MPMPKANIGNGNVTVIIFDQSVCLGKKRVLPKAHGDPTKNKISVIKKEGVSCLLGRQPGQSYLSPCICCAIEMKALLTHCLIAQVQFTFAHLLPLHTALVTFPTGPISEPVG